MRKTSGISLMLLIFLTLTLVTFSLLSLSGATADSRLSQETADRTSEYYQAETAAYTVVGEIDSLLAEALQKTSDAKDAKTSWLLACADIPDALAENGFADDISNIAWDAADATLSFDTAINDSQVLHAALLVTWPENDFDTLYTISAWQTINTQDWTPDQTQDLF